MQVCLVAFSEVLQSSTLYSQKGSGVGRISHWVPIFACDSDILLLQPSCTEMMVFVETMGTLLLGIFHSIFVTQMAL